MTAVDTQGGTGAGLTWSLGLVTSLAAHGAVAVLMATMLQPDPIADQPLPKSNLQIETQEVAQSQAAEQAAQGTTATTASAKGSQVSEGVVPQSRAEAAVLPTDRLAATAPPEPTTRPAAPKSAKLAESAKPAAVKADPAKAVALPPVQPSAAPVKPVAASTVPVKPVTASTAPVKPVAASAAPVKPVAATAAPVKAVVASAAPVKAATTTSAPVKAVATPADQIAAVQAVAAAIAPVAEALPVVKPVAAQPVAAPAQDLASLAAPVLASADTAPTLQPVSQTAPTLQPAADTGAPLAEAPQNAETAPEAAPDLEAIAAAPADGEHMVAALAWSGADAQIDPQSLKAISSFMRPGDATEQSDEVRDGLSALLSSVPCARLQAEFNPATGSLELRGHVPEEGLRGPILQALQEQLGDGIKVADAMLILPRPQCGALSGIGDVGLPQSTDQNTNAKLIGTDAQARAYTYTTGQTMVLDLAAPDYDAYLYVDFFDANGQVIHLVPNETVPLKLRPAKTAMRVGAPDADEPFLNITIGPPYGQEIAAAFAASAPLYDGLRPLSEPADAYLAWLKTRVAEARARDPDFKGEWVYFFVSTRE